MAKRILVPVDRSAVADTVAEAMLAGALRKDDFWEVAVDLWAFIHGHIALYRGGRFAFSESEFRVFFRRSLNRFLKGLAHSTRRSQNRQRRRR